VKIHPFIVLVLIFTAFTAACSSPTPTAEPELPGLPTPDVPPLSEIDAAIERWKTSNTTRYFAEVEERNQEERWMIRLLVADNLIRSAQRLDLDPEGNWGEPVSISAEEAQAYTVDSILQRIRDDALGKGPSLVNMTAAFSKTLGYPLAVLTEALPSYTEEGTLVLNRQLSYDLTMKVEALMEDTFGVDQQPIYTLVRSGGPNAWCDNLRIFSDGSSIYVDDCRDEILQIPTPESRMALLDELRSSFASLDDLRVEDDRTLRLIIVGTGEGTPDATTLEQAWQVGGKLHEILSEPIGLGLLMSYIYNGVLFGFDIFNKISLPSLLPTSGEIRSGVLTPDGKFLAYNDDDGLSVFDIQSQQSIHLLSPPEGGYYLPRSWSNADQLFVSLIPENDSEPFQHGWVSLEVKTWQELPTPDGIRGYGCDTGAAWSPEGDVLAITGLEYGEPCNSSPGLSLVDLSSNSAQTIIAPTINTGEEDDGTLIAGAHTPAWSPDATWIAFSLDQDATEPLSFPTRLYRVHPDGSNLTPLTSNSQGKATHPVWAQDGSLYYGLSGEGADLDGLYHYLPAENTHTVLIPGLGIHPLSISPDGEFLLFEQDQVLRIWQFRLQEVIAEIAGEEDISPTFVGWILLENEQ
jgi:hypothetical protein